MLMNRQVILAKIESTPGVDSSPVASTDAVQVSSITTGREALRMVDQNVIEANIGTRAMLYAGSLQAIAFDVLIRGSGAAGTAPEVGPLLRACGMGETISAGVSVEYEPVSTGHESITIYRYLDGKLLTILGCMGNVSFNFTTGGAIIASFNFIGHRGVESDSAIVTPTYDTTTQLIAINGGFAVGGYGAIIQGVTLDMSNTLATPPNFNAADGYSSVQITKRDPNGSFDPEDVLLATEDFESDFEAGTALALTTGTLGSVAGNRLLTTMPVIKYRSVGEGNRDGVATKDIPFGADRSAGDDEVSFLFT